MAGRVKRVRIKSRVDGLWDSLHGTEHDGKAADCRTCGCDPRRHHYWKVPVQKYLVRCLDCKDDIEICFTKQERCFRGFGSMGDPLGLSNLAHNLGAESSWLSYGPADVDDDDILEMLEDPPTVCLIESFHSLVSPESLDVRSPFDRIDKLWSAGTHTIVASIESTFDPQWWGRAREVVFGLIDWYEEQRQRRSNRQRVEQYRLQLHSEQSGRCAICSSLRLPVGQDSHIDHIYPVSRGGTGDYENLQLLCPHCNLVKHDRLPGSYTEIG